MASRSVTTKAEADESLEIRADGDSGRGLGCLVPGVRLQPIRYVERELTRRDGSKLRVKVPVYPPFRLEERPSPKTTPDSRKRAPGQRKAS